MDAEKILEVFDGEVLGWGKGWDKDKNLRFLLQRSNRFVEKMILQYGALQRSATFSGNYENDNSLADYADYADFFSKFLKVKRRRNKNLAQIAALFEHFFCDGVTEFFFWKSERYFAITEKCECGKLDR